MPKQSKFSLAEFNRLKGEGNSIAEITKILGISKATLYRYLNAATQNTDPSALKLVEHYWNEYCDTLLKKLSTDNISPEDQKTLRSELQQLHLALVLNVADASKLAKKIEAYLKFSE